MMVILEVRRILEKRNFLNSGVNGLLVPRQRLVTPIGFWDSPFPQPGSDGVKEQFVATVCIFLPSSQLIIYGQRNTFLEPLAGPSRKTNDVTICLELQRHLKIFRDMRFGPEFLVAIVIEVANLLNCRPSKDSVVTDERSDITIADRIFDGGIDEIREKCDTLFWNR